VSPPSNVHHGNNFKVVALVNGRWYGSMDFVLGFGFVLGIGLAFDIGFDSAKAFCSDATIFCLLTGFGSRRSDVATLCRRLFVVGAS